VAIKVGSRSSQELDGLGHGGLDVNRLHVVPALLEEGDQEVDRHHDVLLQLLIGEALSTDGGVEAGDLLELPFDGGTVVINLVGDGLVVGNDLGEHTNSVEDGAADDGDLLEDGVGSQQHGVLLGPGLDLLLVLVVLLEVIKGNDFDVALGLGDLVLMLLVGNDADLEGGTGAVGKTDGTNESLVLLGIVVLKSDLELNGLLELALLHLFSEFHDGLSDGGVVDLGGHTP